MGDPSTSTFSLSHPLPILVNAPSFTFTAVFTKYYIKYYYIVFLYPQSFQHPLSSCYFTFFILSIYKLPLHVPACMCVCLMNRSVRLSSCFGGLQSAGVSLCLCVFWVISHLNKAVFSPKHPVYAATSLFRIWLMPLMDHSDPKQRTNQVYTRRLQAN